MSNLFRSSLGVLCLAGAAMAQTPPTIIGDWETLDRHVAMGSLYQPVHGVRKREGLVRFAREGERLVGHAIHEDHRAITHQERWQDGRTEFRQVTFAGGKLSFEWDIGEWFPTAGPVAVEDRKLASKGTVRVEAALQGERLVGTWKMYLVDGTEVFRGEWEATRLIPGPVLLIGGRHQDLTAEIRSLVVKLAGGPQARIVVIPTGVADGVLEDREQFRTPFLEYKPWSVEVLHTRDPKTANDPAFVSPLTKATAVFFTNGHRDRIFNAYRGTLVEQEIKKLRARGKLVAGTGTGAAILGDLLIDRAAEGGQTEPGLGILPGFLIEDRSESERFPVAARANPAKTAVMVDPGAALVVHGGKLRAVGAAISVGLPQEAGPDAKVETLQPGQELALPAQHQPTAAKKPNVPAPVIRDEVAGSIHHGGGKSRWQRLTGQVRVLGPSTLEYADGTRVELGLVCPALEQMAMNGDTLYPCGREATEYLRRLIGERSVTSYGEDNPRNAYVGDLNLERAMIVGGWALADHSSLQADEVIARENKRGLWRGKFLHPNDWRAGLRLPGEPPPAPIADEREAAQLLAECARSAAAVKAVLQRIARDVPQMRQLFLPPQCTDEDLGAIAQLTNLEVLSLGGEISDAGLVHLKLLPKLTNLGLTTNITDAGLVHLRTLTQLKHLNLAWAPHTDAGLARLASLTELESLHLGYAEITDAGLAHLAGMHNLRRLRLHNTKITDAGLAHLCALKRLAMLDIHQTRISDGGMQQLKELGNLLYLDVSGNGISDAGLAPLSGLAKLQILRVSDPVTPAARRRLQKAIPGLRFEGGPEDVP